MCLPTSSSTSTPCVDERSDEYAFECIDKSSTSPTCASNVRSEDYALECMYVRSDAYACKSIDESSDEVAHHLTSVCSRRALRWVRPRVH